MTRETKNPTSFRPRMVKCPQCKNETLYAEENQWRPFCSKFCATIDLGVWASEGYRVASFEEEFNELESSQEL